MSCYWCNRPAWIDLQCEAVSGVTTRVEVEYVPACEECALEFLGAVASGEHNTNIFA